MNSTPLIPIDVLYSEEEYKGMDATSLPMKYDFPLQHLPLFSCNMHFLNMLRKGGRSSGA